MRRFVFFAIAYLALGGALGAQSSPGIALPPQSETTFLQPGKPIEREMRGAEKHSYKVSAEAGQFVRVVALKKGIDVSVTLLDPSGKQILFVDSLNGAYGPEAVSIIAEDSGDLRLEVSASSLGAPAGHYQIQLTDLRAPRMEDRLRISAESDYREGEGLWWRFDAESRTAAVGKWDESFRLWQALDDKYEQALSLYGIGRIYRALGEKQKALDSFNQALPLWRAAGDEDGEAGTLNNIGCIYNGPGREQKSLDYLNQALLLWRAAGDRDGEAWTLNNIGNIYNGLGDKPKALHYYNQALPLWRAAGDRDGEAWELRNIGRGGEAGTLNNIGNAYRDLADKPKALEYYQQALMVCRAAGNRNCEAQALISIGNAYNGLGEKQLRLDNLSEALPLEPTPGDRNGQAQALRNMGGAHGGLQEKEKALDYYNQALTLWRAAGDPGGEAGTLMSIGNVYYGLGDKRKALDYYHQTLPLWRAAHDRNGEAQVLLTIGGAYSNIWEKQKALDFFNQALPLWRAVGNRDGEAATLTRIGRVYTALREEQKALDYYYQALPLWRAVHDRDGEAVTLNCIGTVYDALGEKQKALDYYNQAVPLWHAVGDGDGEGLVLISIGGVYDVLGEKQKALDYYNQAFVCWRAVRDRDAEAWALNSIGRVYYDLGEMQKALDCYTRALPLSHAVQNPDAEAGTLNNIGQVYGALGEKQKALDYCNRALTLWRAVGDREGEAWALNSIGRVYFDLGDKQKALDCYTQALPLFRTVQNPLSESSTLLSLMDYWKALDNPSLAIFFGKQAIDRFQQVRRNIQGLEKEVRESFIRSKESYYRELAELLIQEGRLAEAQQVLDLLKLEEYSEFTQRRGDTGSATQPLARTPREEKAGEEYDKITGDITAIGEERTQLRAQSSRSADEEHRYNELSDRLTAAEQRFQAFLITLYASFGKGDQANDKMVNADRWTAGLKTLVGELGAGTVALYTLVLEQKCVVIVITPATRVAREMPISKSALRSKVFAFLQALAVHGSEEEILPKAQDLYNVLIAPIEKDLQGAQARTLVWSLDDDLSYVPLAALYDGKQYLVERYRDVVITIASVGNLKDKPQVGSWRGLAMGVSKDYDGLGELKAVPGELGSVVRSDNTPDSHGPVPGTILLDDSFTERRMETALDQHPPLVHIASHYVFHVGDDTKSYLLLGGKDTGGQGFHLTLADLRDDQRMDFQGIELLTLSGCETAKGSNNSDGREIDGLGITAQNKGAKAVLATLWEVDDASVGLLMAKFYKLWVTTPGITKAEALQQAQLALLHGTTDTTETPQGSSARDASASASRQHPAAPYANPYYWAPFILIGNWK
jgi:CHAT domain-containing protein/tetratricopeptide (TPR) repeat protein